MKRSIRKIRATRGVLAIFVAFVMMCGYAAKRVSISKSSQGVWAVYVDQVPDGFGAIDSESCKKWAKDRYGVQRFESADGGFWGLAKEDDGAQKSSEKDERMLSGLCGVKFGQTDAGGIPVALGVDKGLVTRQFTPAKQFDEFDECFCLSTPKTHRVCKVYLIKSQLTGWEGSPDQLDESLRQKYLAIKPILERKYQSRCLSSYSWTIGKKEKKEVGVGFRFPNGTLDFSIADEKDRENLWGGMGWLRRALMIVATDKNLVELGKREAEELDREKVSDSADAL